MATGMAASLAASMAAGMEEPWLRHGKRCAPLLWDELWSRGFYAAAIVNTLDDMDSGERQRTLDAILQRTATDEEVAELDVLLLDSGTFASQRRRMQNASLNRPGAMAVGSTGRAEEEIPIRTILEARLAAALPAGGVSAFPAGRRTPRVDKDRRRDLLARKVGQIIADLGLPAGIILASSAHPERMEARFAGGRRLSTLAQKINSFEKMSDWLKAAYGCNFPRNPVELLDYILERGAEPCGPSVPASILNMVSFLEHVGGVEEANKLGCHTTVQTVAQDLALDLKAGKQKLKTKANQLPLVFCNQLGTAGGRARPAAVHPIVCMGEASASVGMPPICRHRWD
jgi:hypothetical protein